MNSACLIYATRHISVHVVQNRLATGCTTGWMNNANEPSQAALERASQDVYDIVPSQQGCCLDSRRCGTFDQMQYSLELVYGVLDAPARMALQ